MTEQDTFDTLRRIPRAELEKLLGVPATRDIHFRARILANEYYQHVPVTKTVRRTTVYHRSNGKDNFREYTELIEKNDIIVKKFHKTGWTVDDYLEHLVTGYVRRLEHNHILDIIFALVLFIYAASLLIGPLLFVNSFFSVGYVGYIMTFAAVGFPIVAFATKKITDRYTKIENVFD